MASISISNLNELEMSDLNDFETIAVGGGYCTELDNGGNTGVYLCQDENSTFGGGQVCFESEELQMSICVPL